MMKRNTILRENHEAAGATMSPASSPNPTSLKQKSSNSPSNPSNSSTRKHKSSKENAPPPYHPLDLSSSPAVGLKTKSPLPPRPPPNSNNLKRKLNLESGCNENAFAGSSDSGVKVKFWEDYVHFFFVFLNLNGTGLSRGKLLYGGFV